jgi:acylpyruvate hydrolase
VKRAPAAARRPLKGLAYGLPVAAPGKVICLGLNYLEHVKEGSQRDNIPKFPTIFMRGRTSLVPHGQPIIRPKASETLDYEAELIFIVGKRAKHLTTANAYSCIAGYSCGNEGSVREFQRKTTQWDMGKNFDRTGGFGPWMVTADEVPPGAKGLKIESRLNGQVMQSDNTDNMMFPVAETIAYVTQGMTLEPGDIVFTGTPSGVGHARKPNPVWMKAGDTCEISRASACSSTRSRTRNDALLRPHPEEAAKRSSRRMRAASCFETRTSCAPQHEAGKRSVPIIYNISSIIWRPSWPT